MSDVRYVWVGAPEPYVPWTVLMKQAWGWMQSRGLFKHSHLPPNVMTPVPHTTVCRTVFIVLRYARCRMRKIRMTVWRHVVWWSDVTFHQANPSHKTYTCQKSELFEVQASLWYLPWCTQLHIHVKCTKPLHKLIMSILVLTMLIKVQLNATVCRHLFTATSLYMFRVSCTHHQEY